MQWSLGFLNEASEISAARKSAVFGTPRPNKWLAEADSPDLPFIGFTFVLPFTGFIDLIAMMVVIMMTSSTEHLFWHWWWKS